METIVEIMRVHDGFDSAAILTGTNVIDTVPSEYSLYGGIFV
jgi:hypothetical protein